MATIIVKQRRGFSGQPEKIRRIVRALGLRRIDAVREHKDNNCIRGMINKVKHMVTYEVKP